MQITVTSDLPPGRRYHFCLDHYLEALAIGELMRRLTGIPAITHEGQVTKKGNSR